MLDALLAIQSELLLAILIPAGIVVGLFVTFFALRIWFRTFKTDIPLVVLNVTQGPLILATIFLAFKISLPDTADLEWVQRSLTAGIVVAVTFWVAQLIAKVLAYYLKQYAEKSEATWDDVLVPILETVLPIVIYILGAFIFLQSLKIDLTGLWVAFGGATFVLGFALQDILSNFFSGLVLLIDTPFQFGDVITLPSGSLAIIQKIGIRVTQVYVIETNCEMYIPNGQLEAQNIINLSRPSPSIYYSLSVSMRTGVDPTIGLRTIREVVMAHPDTLGKIDEKLQAIEAFSTFAEGVTFKPKLEKLSKKEAGRLHLTAERQVDEILKSIQKLLKALVSKIEYLEAGGLDTAEMQTIQTYFLDILKQVGLEPMSDRGKRKAVRLAEMVEDEEHLIRAVRNWCEAWSSDPNLSREDVETLRRDWERKIELLKGRLNRLYQKLSQPQGDETRLDDAVMELSQWLEERFKSTDAARLYEPKIWIDQIKWYPGVGTGTWTILKVKFFVDNVKLEQCQRGYRVKGEVYGEIMRRFRESFVY